MPSLSDVLGTLMQELGKARLAADLQTKEIAKIYAGDEILNKMTVPRFRLPDINLTIPFAISGLSEAAIDGEIGPRPGTLPLDNQGIFSLVYGVIKERLKIYQLKTDRDFYDKFYKEAYRMIAALEEKMMEGEQSLVKQIAEFAERVSHFGFELLSKVYGKKIPKSELKEIQSLVEQRVGEELIQFPSPQKQLDIIIETGKIQEFSAEKILNLQLQFNEEGLQWSFGEDIDEDGEPQSRRYLTPE